MKRFKLLIVIVLILGTLVLLTLKLKKLLTPNQQTKIDIYTNFELTGILREMDLSEDMKTATILTEGRFQLTTLNTDDVKKLPYETTSLFIEKYPMDLTDLIGKCVTIKGKLDTDWISKMGKVTKENKFAYNALVFVASDVNKNDYSKCTGYSDYSKREDGTSNMEIPKELKPVTLSGSIRRLSRSVPDVGPYDYIFVFTEPYTSENNASGLPQKMDYMPIAPQNNDIWVKLENKVGKTTAVEAYELWGFVESKYLLVTRVME